MGADVADAAEAVAEEAAVQVEEVHQGEGGLLAVAVQAR